MIHKINITQEDFGYLREMMSDTDTEIQKHLAYTLKESDLVIQFIIVCPTCLDRKEVATDPTGQDTIPCPDCKKEPFEE